LPDIEKGALKYTSLGVDLLRRTSATAGPPPA
jgi:hypothetical protein